MRDLTQVLERLREDTDAAQRNLIKRGANKILGLSRQEKEAVEHLNRARHALGLARATLLETV